MGSSGDLSDAAPLARRRDLTSAIGDGAATALTVTLWLVALHVIEGSHERAELPFALHWLRDGALALPVAIVGAGLGLRLAAAAPRAGAFARSALTALTTGTLLVAMLPVHEALFVGGGREAENLSLPVHLAREWLIALAVAFCAMLVVDRFRRAGGEGIPARALAWGGLASVAIALAAVAWLLVLQLQVAIPEVSNAILVKRAVRDGLLTAPLVAVTLAVVLAMVGTLRRRGHDRPLAWLGVAGAGAVALSLLIGFAAPVTERMLELFRHGAHPLVDDAKLVVLPGSSGGSLALHVADRALAVLPLLIAAGLVAVWLAARRNDVSPSRSRAASPGHPAPPIEPSGELWLPAMTRRDILKLGAVAGVALSVPLRASTARADSVSSPRFTPFTRRLTFPDPIAPAPPGAFVPTKTPDPAWGTPKLYEVEMRENEVEIIPGLSTRIFGYNGTYPGPTFRVRNGEPAIVRFRNSLAVPTVVHNHGGTQSGMVGNDPNTDNDGFPSAFVQPGTFKDYLYPNIPPFGDVEHADFASTQWYHDHAMDITGPNVYAGLAGFYLLTDDREAQLIASRTIPDTAYDLPLVFQDRRFNASGKLIYDSAGSQGALGDVFVVNGKAQPYIEVERKKYRFRFLNGANARYFQLELSNGAPFLVIGTDTWLLPFAIQQASIPLAMSQRADVIIDFRTAPSEVFLMNVQQQDDPKKPGDIRRPGVPVVKFVVKDGPAINNASAVPGTLLRPHVRLLPQEVVVTRTFDFERHGGNWVINRKTFNPNRNDATPSLGAVERWNFRNGSGGWTHPIHVHLEAMQIQTINGKAPTGIQASKRDSVNLGPNGQASMLIRFRSFPGRYVFHCHNLEHEDMRMMAAFEVRV